MMIWTRYSPSFIVILFLSAAVLPAGSLLAAPQVRSSTAPVQLALKFKPPKMGLPIATTGGGSRGACSNFKSLTPLLPKSGSEFSSGLTLAERPSFFFHLPQTPVQTAELLLLEADGASEILVYQKTFTLPSNSGIVRVDLPADAPGLQEGKQYYWYITLLCDPKDPDPSKNPSIKGGVRRIPANSDMAEVRVKLTQADPANYPAIYAEAGIWQDTLLTLAELRRQSPNNASLVREWRELLRSVGLNEVANEPLIN